VHEEQALIELTAIGLSLAFVFGYIAVRLRLSPIIGYLLAGIAVGPFTPGFVGEAKIASQLAEIGVMLMMFGVGMHFSVADLWAVRSIAVPGAIVQIVVATALGAAAAAYWGWSLGAGLIFGLALSVASTVVVLRALESVGTVDRPEGKVAVGWLIVEDLVMVLALVLLPALAGQGHGADGAPEANAGATVWISLGIALGKVAVFVAAMLLFGVRIFPWLLHRVEETRARELFTLAIVAIALGVAFLSAKLFGVSFALGAFFAGVVLHKSDFHHRATTELLPLQDAFGILFFVAVGMLFDPMVLVRHPVQVLVVVVIIIVGKSLTALGIVLALRRGWPMACTVAAALAQIGEFSFVLAGLGVGLKLISEEARNLILAGALLSISLNPFVFRAFSRLSAGGKNP
jgi:CPA2 family monovalent cation:H+ antiporter-2